MGNDVFIIGIALLEGAQYFRKILSFLNIYRKGPKGVQNIDLLVCAISFFFSQVVNDSYKSYETIATKK